jgi:Xaa-Pro aminopeptidase
MPYRQDSDFYYLTGWNEPGAALLIVGADAKAASPRPYSETLFLPTRNLRMEKYTGVKLDAVTPGAAETAGADAVGPMTALPAALNGLIDKDRRLGYNIWTQPGASQAKALVEFAAVTLGQDAAPATHDVTTLTMPLRQVKDEGEIALLEKASVASIAAQRAMMRDAKPGVTERAIAGKMTAVWMENGCERPSYAPIVGSGINSTTLHYSENSRTMEDGDLLLVDAACEYSMYASDTLPRGSVRYTTLCWERSRRPLTPLWPASPPSTTATARTRIRWTRRHTTTSTPMARVWTASRWGSIGCTGWATW